MALSITNHPYVLDDQGATVLDVERGLVLTLNATAAQVWKDLKDGLDVKTIAANLALATGSDASVVELDVRDFVEKLVQKRLWNHDGRPRP